MDTYIVGKNAEGQDVNSSGQEVIDCSQACGRKTTMVGTGLCDQCWEEQRRKEVSETQRMQEEWAAKRRWG